MSNHQIIKALQEKVAKERDDLFKDYAVDKFGPDSMETKECILDCKYGHEAASDFWLPLIEKALEMAEFYADRNVTLTKFLKDGSVQVVNMTNAFTKPAEEFLTTLADASGDK